MLDARRAEQKGYITLKKAAQISNYSPDYVGQLIRSGKIRGEQVYQQVVWVTTEDEIRAYMERIRTGSNESELTYQEAVVARYTNPILYVGIVLVTALLLFVVYLLSVSIDDAIDRAYASQVLDDSHAYNES